MNCRAWVLSSAAGLVLGFVATNVFMLAGYEGDAVVEKLPFFVLLGIFGGVCGLIWAWLGRFLHARFVWQRNDWS